jgi:hypothetical protein
MLGPLFRWLHARALRRRREIFRYFDGQAIRFADPLAIVRALDEHETYLEEKHFDECLRLAEKGASSGTKEERLRYHRAAAVCVDAVRKAFGILPYDQGGLQIGECLDLLASFIDYLDGVKKNTSPSLTSSPTSEDATSPVSSETTPSDSSPSTCSATAVETADPTSSVAATSPDSSTSNSESPPLAT